MAEKANTTNYYMDRVMETKPFSNINDSRFSERLMNKIDSDLKSNDIIDDLDPTSSAHNKTTTATSSKNINIYDSLYHSSNMRRNREEVYGTSSSMFTKIFRFGLYNPFGQISTAREFLFFTKPDLHILKVNKNGNVNKSDTPNDGLESYFWTDLIKSKKRIVRALQLGCNPNNPFNYLLQNTVNNNLEVPSLSAPSIETSSNSYGVSLTYRGSSEESDDGPEFSLEFKDDKYLNVYSFFRAYEEYETLKKHGRIAPQEKYILNKVIHDQFAIYKFIVDEDMESIIYWGKYYGVYPVSLPRDAFSSDNFADGLSFSINFKAAFYEDMRPEILYDFNALSKPIFDNCKYRVDVYNEVTDRADGRAAKAAMVFRVENDVRAKQNPNGYYYRLVWKGDDTT